MENSVEYLRWRLSGHLNLSNTRSGFQISPIPKEVISDFQLENCRQSYEADTNHVATSLTVQNNRLAATLDSGDIIFQDKTTLEPLHRFQAHPAAIFDLKWRQSNTDGSPNNGRNFITASGDRSIVFWDAETCQRISQINEAHTGSVKTLAFHDANLFASGGRDGSVKLWDLRTSVKASKFGPEFCIENSHCPINGVSPSRRKLPFSKAKARQSPIAAKAFAAKNAHNSPRNVVTSVCFKSQFSHHLYTSGIADNCVRMWDIRRCISQFKFANLPMPSTVHTIKNCYNDQQNLDHGFRQLHSLHVSGFGNVLLASSTDNRIYCFVNDEMDPIAAFVGVWNKNFVSHRIQSLKNRYLLSGSSEGRVYAWNLHRVLDNAFNSEPKPNIVATHLPSHYFPVGTQRETVECVAVDETTSRVYSLADDFRLYQWSLYSSKIGEQERFANFAGRSPKAEVYSQPEGQAAPKDIVLKTAKRPFGQCGNENSMATPPKRHNFFKLSTC